MNAKRIVVRPESVEADATTARTIWRTLYPEVTGMEPSDMGAIAGVAAYNPAEGTPPLGPAHEEAEFYYVISGQGVVLQGDDRLEVSEGDTFINPPNTPHTLFSTTDAPLVTFYVAIQSQA